MSFFKTSWIILKINPSKDNDFLFDVFTYDYWKIKLKTKKLKKQKNLDVWYIINFEINVKKENSIHEINNIKIKNEFDYLWKNYEVIINFLELIKIINEKCPLNMPIFEIFNILNELNNSKNITDEKIIFTTLKALNILWLLKLENSNQTIQKILSFISKESIKNILKLTWLDENTKKELKNIISSFL